MCVLFFSFPQPAADGCPASFPTRWVPFPAMVCPFTFLPSAPPYTPNTHTHAYTEKWCRVASSIDHLTYRTPVCNMLRYIYLLSHAALLFQVNPQKKSTEWTFHTYMHTHRQFPGKTKISGFRSGHCRGVAHTLARLPMHDDDHHRSGSNPLAICWGGGEGAFDRNCSR